MSKDMSFFMKGRAKQTPEIEEVISTRYVDEEGNPIPFRFKPLATDRIEAIQEECLIPVTRKGRKVDEKLDDKRFAARLGIETTVYPDFKDPELLKSYGVVDPVDAVKAVLSLGGEYAEWIRVIQRVNGFDEEFEDLVDEAKN